MPLSSKQPLKKKRTLGEYPCPHCDKVFTRSDHLARHNLNHEPKKVYTCEFVMQDSGDEKRICGKTFVRKDLNDRHSKRHLEMAASGATLRKASVSTTSSDTLSQSQLQISNLINEEVAGYGSQNTFKESVYDSMYRLSNLSNNGSNGSIKLGYGGKGSLAGSSMAENMNPTSENDSANPSSNMVLPSSANSMVLLSSASMTLPSSNTILPSSTKTAEPYQDNNENAYNRNLSDYYNKSNYLVPHSQNDILYWLFTDSPPNNINMSSPDWNQLHNQLSNQGNNINNQQITNIPPHITPQEQLLINQQVFANNVQSQNTDTPIPYQLPSNASKDVVAQRQQGIPIPQDAPRNSSEHFADFPTSNHIIPSPGGSQLSLNGAFYDGGISPFSNYANQFQVNLGLQDSNIFLNDDNPLDEVFLKNHQHIKLEKDYSGMIPTSNVNFNGTIASNSPSTSTDSNKSPKQDISPEFGFRDAVVPQLNQYSQKFNLAINKHFFIDTLIVDLILRCLTLDRASILSLFNLDDPFSNTIEDRFSYFLFYYWKVFHPQFTILHKPSFNTKLAEPLLLASMLLIGCIYSYSPNEAQIKERKKSPEFKFSLLLATPLRFQIFQHDDFRSPTKLWVLQSLNLLEFCEKNFLLRRMHERGHIHHGTNVQLLRRSPLLGGNPATTAKKPSASGSTTSAGEEDSDSNLQDISNEGADNSDLELFEKWVNSESMKRITFMTFYLDVIDYIKFSHNPQILFWQLQLLSLPCDDEQLWESTEVNGSFKKVIKRQRKLHQQKTNLASSKYKKKNVSQIKHGESFLSALKKLLKPGNRQTATKRKTSLFTRNIILAGLIALMYQMQQSELQNSSFLFSNAGSSYLSKVWKEHVTKAINNWYSETIEQGNSLYIEINEFVGPQPILFAMYQLSQIIGITDINHYDIAIYGGSPANMSVSALIKDIYAVQRKLNGMWSKKPSKKVSPDIINFRGIVHCYWILWQLMLNPVENGCLSVNWQANNDYFDSMYAIAVSTLVLWCHVYSTGGSESTSFLEIEDEKKGDYQQNPSYENLIQLSVEGGYEYLARIRQEFLTKLENENLRNDLNIHPLIVGGQHSLHDKLTKYGELLPDIADKHHISGLCFLVGSKLLESQWEVIRENAKLIINCGLRSVGKNTILCENLFEDDFRD